jgi:tetratricopeptide (TPR) repeat protein
MKTSDTVNDRPPIFARYCALVAVAALAGACGRQHTGETTPKPSDAETNRSPEGTDDAVTPQRLDGFQLIGSVDGEDVKIELIEARTIFDEGVRLHEEDNLDEAVTVFTRIVEGFPESPLAAPALYNRALSYERLERFEEAAAEYRVFLERYPDSKDALDAKLRYIETLRGLERWAEVIEEVDKVRRGGAPLTDVIWIRGLALEGEANLQIGEHERARQLLSETVRSYERHKDELPEWAAKYASLAQFNLGEIDYTRMHEVELPQDETKLRAALEWKCFLLLSAQHEFTRAIEFGHPDWAAAAAFRIGDLYAVLRDDILAAPVPADLNEEEAEVYREVLRDQLVNLVAKAVKQWERTVELAKRLDLEGPWIERTEISLETARELLAEEER